MSEYLETPLKDRHIELGGKMVPFAGWFMPVQYVGLREEHVNVRQNVGLFDVSHMGELRVKGPKALETVQWVTSNDVSKLSEGDAQYSLFINETGGVVDDLIVYCLKKNEDYLLCVNASNKDKDWAWLQKHSKGAVLEDQSSQWGQIAVQGPKALALLDQVFSHVSEMKSFTVRPYEFKGAKCLVARTGYTGEDGAEVFVPWENTVALWNEFLNKGKDLGVMPIGLGARDTLRTEMKYPLYGNELNDELNPYAAGLGWVIKPKEKDFLGRAALLEGKDRAPKRKLIGFVVQDKAIARAGYPLVDGEGRSLGFVTSGTPSPSLGQNIGVGYVDPAFSHEGAEFFVEIRGRKVKSQVVKTPFVSRS